MEKEFTEVFINNLWNGTESISGTGSCAKNTQTIARFLPFLFKFYNIKTIIDAPCGDFNWMKNVDLQNIEYLGIDIVPSIIDNNNNTFSNESTKFVSDDITKNVVNKTDLIFCRDCLVHLTFEDGLSAIKNFKDSGSKYLLTTTFNKAENRDVETSGWNWRPLNLQLAPFSLPAPLLIFNEGGWEDPDKSLGLWDLHKIEFQ